MHRVCSSSSSAPNSDASLVSDSSDATLGESSGVARGSVRRISWIATSSSEMTLAEVLAEVGAGVAYAWLPDDISRVDFNDIRVILRGDENVEGGSVSGTGGINGRLYC